MAEKELKIKVTADTKSLKDLKAEFKKNQEELDKLTASGKRHTDIYKNIQNAQKQLGNEIKGLTREYKGLDAQVKMSRLQFLEMFENITVTVAGIVAASKAVVDLGQKLFTAAKQGADFGILMQSLSNIGIGDAELQLMRLASAGNLSAEQLGKFALGMNLLGLSVDETTVLLDKIEIQADKTARSFEDSNEAVQKFIATGSSRSLLGFVDIAELNNEFDKLVLSTGKAENELSDIEKEGLRANAMMNTLSESTDDLTKKQFDNADALASIVTNIDNSTIAFKKGLSDGITPFFMAMSEKINISSKQWEEFGELLGTILSGMIDDFYKAGDEIYNALKPAFDWIGTKIKELGDWMDEQTFTQEELKQRDKIKKEIEDQKRIDERIDYLIKQDIQLGKYGKEKKDYGSYKGRSGKSDKLSESEIKKQQKEIEKALLETAKQNILSSSLLNINNTKLQDRDLSLGLRDIWGNMTNSEITAALNFEQISEKQKNNIEETYDKSLAVFGNLQSLFGLLDSGTSKFINDMLTFFQTITSIAEGVSIVRSLLSVFGFGSPAGLPYISGGNTNVFISANVKGIEFMRHQTNQYNRFKNAVRI